MFARKILTTMTLVLWLSAAAVAQPATTPAGQEKVAPPAPTTKPAEATAAPATKSATEPPEATTKPVENATAPEATTAPAEADVPAPAGPTDLAAPAAETPAPPKEKADLYFTFGQVGSSIRDVIRWIAKAYNKPILGDIDAVGSHKFTYYDAQPYTRTEAMGIVNEVLRTKGFTIMDAGRYLKVVPLKALPQQPELPLVKDLDETTPRDDDEIVTTILPLQFIEAGQAVSIMARMVSSFGTLSTLGKGQGIIITDSVVNIRRIQRLLQAIDKSGLTDAQLKYYQLKSAPAADVAGLIDRLFNEARRQERKFAFNSATGRYEPVPTDPGETVSATADPRTNMLVVVARPEKHRMIEEFITRVDVETKIGEGGVQLYALENAKAEDLAQTLTNAAGTKTITAPDPRGRGTIARQIPAARIVADAATNHLIISAEPDVMKQLEEMIAKLDAAAVPGAGVRIFPLKVANAASLVSVIQTTFASRSPRGGRGATTSQDFSVTADTRTNSLVVKASSADQEAVAKLIEQLDKEGGEQREIHVVRLKAGNARDLAASLGRLVGQRTSSGRGAPTPTGGTQIEADNTTNSLIIAAAPGDWDQIKGLLDELTKDLEDVAAVTRIFPVKHGKAAEIAPSLQRIFDPRQRGVQRGGPQTVPTVITFDAGSNTLLVSASAEDLAEIERLLKTLDTPEAITAQVQVRSYALANVNAAELARSLARLFTPQGRGRPASEEPQPKFEAEANSNQLVVAATAEQFKIIDKLIQDVQGLDDDQMAIKIFPLKNAQAEQLAPTLTRIAQVELAAQQRRMGGKSPRTDFQISADARTNALLVTAPAATMKVIGDLVPLLDADDVTVQITKVVELINADANEMAAAINAALGGQSAPSPRGRGPAPAGMSGLSGRKVIVVPQAGARALLLTGVTEDVEFAEKLIQQIDQRPGTDKPVVKTFAIKHGKAEDIAKVLSATVAGSAPGRGRGATPVRISAEQNANAVVVAATAEVVEQIEELIKQIDVPGLSEGAVTIEIVTLVKAKAEELADALNAAQGSDARARGPRGRGQAGADDEDLVRVTANPASNSLLLTGRPVRLEETKKLIAQLDKAAVELIAEMKIFQLFRAKAADVAPVLEKILLGQVQRGGRGGAAAPDIRIAAQEKANTVVVKAPPDLIALAEQMIKQFEADGIGETVVQVVKLAKAEASSLADAVNAALTEQGAQRGRTAAPAGGPTVVAEPNSNSVLVRGSKAEVAAAIELIRKLDADGAGFGPEVKVFRLQNAEAAIVSKVIDALFRQITSQQQRSAGRNARKPEPFSISADDRTNSLIVQASPGGLATVEALLAQLDTKDDTGGLRPVNYVALLHADPFEMISKLDAMFADRPKGDRPMIAPDEFGAGLTVVAKDADYRVISDMAARLDEAAEPNYVQVRVIPMTGELKAEKLAENLKRIYEQVSGTEVKITNRLPHRPSSEGVMFPAPADPSQTPPAGTAADKTPAPAPEKPAAATPDKPAAAPDQTLPAGAVEVPPDKAPSDAGKAPPEVIISVDPKSNTLIVSAGRREMADIEMLIYNLTSSSTASEVEIKVFKLQVADPTGVAKTLTALFNPRQVVQQQPQRAQQGQRGQRGQQPQPGQPAAPAPQQPAKPTVTIAADVRTRSVIVLAKPTQLDLIDALIKELDKPAIVINDIRIFALKNTDATEIASNLLQLFNPQATSSAGSGQRGATRGAQNAEMVRQMLQMQSAELGEIEAGGVSVTANQVTNSVIVVAPAETMEMVAKIIEELDQAPAGSAITVKMFKVKHADVNEVVATLSQVFARSSTRGTAAAGGRGRGQAAATSAGAVVSGNEAARTVIVSAAADDLPLIEQVIKELDAEGVADATTVKVYSLRQADARSVATALSQTLAQSTSTGGGGRGRTQTTAGAGALRISAETGSNSIVARASDADHQRIAELIAKMDDNPEQIVTMKTIPLTRADARDVSTALTRMLSSMVTRTRNEPRPTVTFDAKTNTLMVSGTAAHLETVDKIVAELEDRKGPVTDVRMITLANNTASEVVKALGSFYGPKATAVKDPADRDVTITFDDRANVVLLSANDEQFARLSALVGKLDVADAGGGTEKVVIPLQYAQADSVGRAIGQAFAPARGVRVTTSDLVVVTAEQATNSLIVSANEKNLEKIRALVKQLDNAETAGGQAMEFIILERAKAADLAKTLSTVARTSQARGSTPASISAVVDSNALVMSGKKTDLDTLMAMAKQLDQAAPPAETEVNIIALKQADATELAKTVAKLLTDADNAARRAGKTVEPVAVSADARTNSLIVAAGEERFKAINQLVNQLDEMTPRRGNLRLIQLKNADPNEVLKAINLLYGSGANGTVGRGSASGSPEVTVLAGQRGLLVNATDEDWEAIQKLVEAMEKAGEGVKPEVLVFPLAKAANTQVANALNQTFRAAARRDHPEDNVTATALAGTNAVVVTAAKDKMEQVAALIKQLDGVDVAKEMQFKTYTLENAIATKILPSLQQMLAPMRQTRPDQQINVTADATANTLIVTTQAPAAVLDEIGRIIKLLDALPPFKTAEVLVVPLKNAEAPALAEALTDMLTPGTGQVLTPEARALQEQVRLLRLQQGKEDGKGLDLTKPIKITSDPLRRGMPGSNSLIVSSTPENIASMSEVIALLDTLPIAEGVRVHLIHLKNADAIAVMNILREIFTQGRQLAGTPGTPTAGKALPETLSGTALVSGLNVTADARTNSLVLAGREESLALARLLVEDLDRQPTSEFTEVKVFKLAHADPDRTAATIRGVFAEQAPAASGVEGARTFVTRLRVEREKANPLSSKIARTHPTLVVQTDPLSNLLIVAARSDLLPLVTELVAKMDIPGAGAMNIVRIYPLANADATQMANALRQLYTGANANLIRPEDRPTITVDVRTNSVIIATSEKTFAVLEALLAKLDAKLPIDLRDIRLLALENADAATLAATLQRMMDARVQRQQALGVGDAESLRMVIISDDRSNTLIVGGSAEGYKLVEDVARRLDQASPALAGQIQIIGLTEANAGSLATTLTNLFNQRYAAARTPDVQRQKPVILPDLRTNALLVSANQDDSKVLLALVARLDIEPEHPAVELVVIPLLHNDAGSVGPIIERIFADRLTAMTPTGQPVAPQDRVAVETEGLANALIVSASKENLTLIRGLLEKVDVEPKTDTGVVKIIPLKHTDVARVMAMLQTLLQQGLYKPALVGAANNAIAQAREKVALTSDLRTNVLIVSASKENIAVIEQIVASIDVKEGWGLVGKIKVYLLQHADATRLGTTLQQMFDRRRTAEAATGTPPRSLPAVIIADARTNALLVTASPEDFEELDAMVAKLDVAQVAGTYDFRIFNLKRASATTLEPILRQLFAQRGAQAGVAAAPVTIIADPKLNTLIVGANRDDLATAAGLIERLDGVEPPTGQEVRAFPIAKADATQLGNTLRTLYEATKPTGGEAGVSITVDERSNTILVSAAAADMERIADLVKKLDTAPTTDVTEIRIFTLRYADATQLAGILTDALTNKPRALTAVSPNRATLLRLVAESPDGQKLISSAVKEGIMITAVTQTNSLLAQAPVETMPLLARLIEALDNTHPRKAEIRVFALKNADATQMARVLTELFRLQAAGTTQSARYTLATTQPAGAAATLGSAEQSALTITVDLRTNSLLVGGTEEYVTLVGNVIQKLDASPAEDRETMVYRLRNAQATDIETALSQFLDQERQRVASTLGANAVGAAQELLAREIAIVAEQTSNTLLVSGSPRFFKTVAAMVKELDQAPPQVLVQVLLAEVTLDDTTEFGVDWSLIGNPGNSHRKVGGGTSFGMAGGGFTFTVTSGDFNLLLRALQSQGRLEVLSRPQILAADNQPAEINIGQRVPFVSNSTITDAGTIRNTITYENVGIGLIVTPHINPDGFVKMEVNPEISSIADSSVQISENLNAIIVNNRSATTTVTIQDGHTAVIGGLITSKFQNREEKVPLVGDIPLLGALFKSSKVVKERTELLIVLTPRVLRTASDSDVLTNMQIRELGVTRSIRDRAVGELLNPLEGVTPLEVRSLEVGGRKPAPDNGPVIIPLTPQKSDAPTTVPTTVEQEYNR